MCQRSSMNISVRPWDNWFFSWCSKEKKKGLCIGETCSISQTLHMHKSVHMDTQMLTQSGKMSWSNYQTNTHTLRLRYMPAHTHCPPSYLLQQPLCQGSHDLGLDPCSPRRRCAWLLRPACWIDDSSITVIMSNMLRRALIVAFMTAPGQKRDRVNMWRDACDLYKKDIKKNQP